MAIAKLECMCCRCGNTFIIRREFRNRSEANNWIEWSKTHNNYDLCSECYRKEQDKAIAEKADALNMPELTGTPKQIAWAEKIRAKALEIFERYVAECSVDLDQAPEGEQEKFHDIVNKCMDCFRNITSAAQWIDLRSEDTNRWVIKKARGE